MSALFKHYLSHQNPKFKFRKVSIVEVQTKTNPHKGLKRAKVKVQKTKTNPRKGRIYA